MKKKKYNRTIVVNLFGGPGRGKSALCGGIFYELKRRGVDAEIAWEYAKGKVWEGSIGTLENQLYMFAKQQHQLFRLDGKVEVVITDAPLLISAVYDETNDKDFRELIESSFKKYHNINFLLLDKFKYNDNGRLQTEAGSEEKHEQIINLLNSTGTGYIELHQAAEDTVKVVCDGIQRQLELI